MQGPSLGVLLASLSIFVSPGLACHAPGDAVPTDPETRWPLVLAEDFATADALASFSFSDPDGWAWSDADGIPSLALVAPNEYAPPHRSPRAIALVTALELGDFDLEVDARQTGREYGHRDLCLFLAYESPARFHYVHLATTPDANAHNVFLVDGAPRRNLLPPLEAGMDWGNGWHRLRLERRLDEGTIRVYVDGATEPALEVSDPTLGRGRVGLGSFDDTGRFTRLRIWSPDAKPAANAEPFGA